MSMLSKIFRAFQRSTSALESAVTELHTYVERQKQVQSATIDMRSGYQLERRYIDIAWASAEKELEIEREYASDPQRRERFEKIRAELEAQFEDMPNRPNSRKAAEHACVDLQPPTPHPSSEIATAIEQIYADTAAEYSAFLSDVLLQLERRRGLRTLFEDRLIGIGGAQILARLKALEAGREWKYLTPPASNRTASSSPESFNS